MASHGRLSLQSLSLAELQFGAPAAEREMDKGQLPEYFVESQAFHRIADGNRRLLLGNRGAGKSAIFAMVSAHERLADNVVIEIAPEDYSYQMFADILAKETESGWAKTGAYAAAWKLLLLLLIMKKLARQPKAKNRANKEEKQMFAFLRDNYTDAADNPLDVLVSYVKRMESVKFGKYEASVKARELTRLYKLEELEPYLETIKSLSRKVRVTVLVDELDRGWDASEDAKAFVAGLFQACNYINRMAPDDLRVFVSLRQELYENIPSLYEDAQKYRDLFEHIHWGPDQLQALLVSRIKYFVPALRLRSSQECMSAVFADGASFRYLINRTLYRPREVIQYATDALEYVRGRGHNGQIGQTALTAVEPHFSKGRMQDLASEYKYQFPGLDSVLGRFRNKRLVWTRQDLEDFCLELATEPTKISSEARDWVIDRYPDDLIEILWRVGFLGIRDRGVKPPSEVNWLPGSPDDPYVDVVRAQEFRINSLFKAHLSLHV